MTENETENRAVGHKGDTSPQGFRALLRNEKIRAILFQVLVVSLILFFLLFIAYNTMTNMEKRGIKTGFAFFNNSSGFGILFSLIDYDESDTYRRVFVVGLLNTILVSVLGAMAATVLGFLIGIARLSQNWLMRKLTSVYIEIFRNLPILLQILFWNVVIKNVMPSPDDPYRLTENSYLSLQGLVIPAVAPNGIFYFFALLFALILASYFILPRWAERRLEATGRTFPVFYTCVSVTVIYFLMFSLFFFEMFEFTIPVKRRFGFTGGVTIIPELFSLIVALAVYTATFIAEAVRSGIEAVDKGQREAASAVGLKPNFIMGRIIMPQAMRVIIPPCINQYLNLTKNSSLAMAIGFPDLVAVFAGTTLNQVGQAIEIMFITMGTYLFLSVSVSLFLNWYNARVKLVER